MKELYISPDVEKVNFLAMEAIASEQGNATQTGDEVFESEWGEGPFGN